MPGTFFSCDVAVMAVGNPAVSVLEIFTDSEISIDNEIDQARAVHDIVDPTINGFDWPVPKARTWSVRLGSVLAPQAPATPQSRMFGWDLVLVQAGGVDATTIFTRANVRITNETAEARAVYDTNPTTATLPKTHIGAAGWRTARIMRRNLEMETDGVVMAGPVVSGQPGGGALFESVLSSWPSATVPTALSYALQGGGIDLRGNGALASGSLRYPSEAAEQTLRIVAQGAPTHLEWVPPPPTPARPIMLLSALQNAPFWLQIGTPGGGTGVYTGQALLTEATLEAPDGACLQGATFTGVGELKKGTYTDTPS